MKTIEGLTPDLKEILKTPLEAAGLRTITTVKDLRMIDKICESIESSTDGVVVLEDADYNYLKQRFTSFETWVPNKQIRSRVIQVADILGAED